MTYQWWAVWAPSWKKGRSPVAVPKDGDSSVLGYLLFYNITLLITETWISHSLFSNAFKFYLQLPQKILWSKVGVDRKSFSSQSQDRHSDLLVRCFLWFWFVSWQGAHDCFHRYTLPVKGCIVLLDKWSYMFIQPSFTRHSFQWVELLPGDLSATPGDMVNGIFLTGNCWGWGHGRENTSWNHL